MCEFSWFSADSQHSHKSVKSPPVPTPLNPDLSAPSLCPSLPAERMAKTRLFALGICLWHTRPRCQHMLHACHFPLEAIQEPNLAALFTTEAGEHKRGEGRATGVAPPLFFFFLDIIFFGFLREFKLFYNQVLGFAQKVTRV